MLYNLKSVIVEEHLRYYLTHARRDKGFIHFPSVLDGKQALLRDLISNLQQLRSPAR